MEANYRLFLAINLEKRAKQVLGSYILELAQPLQPAKPTWVNAELLHISVHFFGEVNQSMKNELDLTLASFNGKFAAASIKSGGLAYLPSPRNPRVMCVDASFDPPSSIQDLVREAKSLAVSVGASIEDRPWRGHITLARLKSPYAPPLAALPAPPCFEFRPKSFDLMLSELRPTGPLYTVLSSYEFARQY